MTYKIPTPEEDYNSLLAKSLKKGQMLVFTSMTGDAFYFIVLDPYTEEGWGYKEPTGLEVFDVNNGRIERHSYTKISGWMAHSDNMDIIG